MRWALKLSVQIVVRLIQFYEDLVVEERPES